MNRPLKIDRKLLPLIPHAKKSTVRISHRNIELGNLQLVADSKRSVWVNVIEVRHTKFDALTDADAQRDGFKDVGSLWAAMKRYYPMLQSYDAPITVIVWE